MRITHPTTTRILCASNNPGMNRNSYAKLARRALASREALMRFNPASLHERALQRAFRNKAFCAKIDRAPVFDKTSLLHAIYQSCGLPAYFGFNWDALLDSLTSLPPAPAYVLALANPSLLMERAPADYATFIQVIRASHERLAERGLQFVLLIPDS